MVSNIEIKPECIHDQYPRYPQGTTEQSPIVKTLDDSLAGLSVEAFLAGRRSVTDFTFEDPGRRDFEITEAIAEQLAMGKVFLHTEMLNPSDEDALGYLRKMNIRLYGHDLLPEGCPDRYFATSIVAFVVPSQPHWYSPKNMIQMRTPEGRVFYDHVIPRSRVLECDADKATLRVANVASGILAAIVPDTEVDIQYYHSDLGDIPPQTITQLHQDFDRELGSSQKEMFELGTVTSDPTLHGPTSSHRFFQINENYTLVVSRTIFGMDASKFAWPLIKQLGLWLARYQYDLNMRDWAAGYTIAPRNTEDR